jgi:subtilase family serine protease
VKLVHKFGVTAAGAVFLASMVSTVSASASSGGGAVPALDQVKVCSTPSPGYAACDSVQLVDPKANWHGTKESSARSKPTSSTTPSGYYPSDLQSAYGLYGYSGKYGSNETVVIVDAYNDPYALKDLSYYRSYFNGKAGSVPGTQTTSIPPICGTPEASGASSCVHFTIYNQNGSTTSHPKDNTSWSEEISLDLDMVSAICPNCNIDLVEANSASFSDLETAVKFAKTLSPVAISNSYGGSEFSSETSANSVYSGTNTTAITVSAGDNGYGVEFPAASPGVTAVGGTTLNYAVSNGLPSWSQTVWSGSGSGCSAYEPAPSWQASGWDVACANRTVADTAADANPNTGVAVYDTYGQTGWLVFGGTSVASPTVSSVYALAQGYDQASQINFSASPSLLYGSSDGQLTNVVSGSNGSCGTYLCNASPTLSPALMPAYDGPTGNGVVNGVNGLGSF